MSDLYNIYIFHFPTSFSTSHCLTFSLSDVDVDVDVKTHRACGPAGLFIFDFPSSSSIFDLQPRYARRASSDQGVPPPRPPARVSRVDRVDRVARVPRVERVTRVARVRVVTSR